ncbi:MAG: HEAT repeat domain-containing protein [Elusimicrobia bacterium]|nr:HEAT repeat domain-containing protein [Elusimicrobiota bacterium]
MTDTAHDSPELRQKLGDVALLLRTLVTSARTAALYQPGHSTIAQICERTKTILDKSLGGENTLTLDIKAKTVVVEESPLPNAPETAAFASALHTLGIGPIVLTNRLPPEGLCEFFKLLVAKPDGKTTLTDLQKMVQGLRIDGLQMVFVLSFVVTGEQDEQEQLPGQLSEEQVAAFIRSANLPDLLTLLLRQNEGLAGKEAETVTDLLCAVLERETTLDEFLAAMPWPRYDPRIRLRCEELAAQAAREADWTRDSLISWTGLLRRADRQALDSRNIHERPAALRWSLDLARALLDRPASPKQPKYARLAYARIIRELAADGRVPELLGELERFAGLEPALRKGVQEAVTSRAFAERLVAHIRLLPKDAPEAARLVEFLAFAGEDMMPLLLGELAGLADKAHRAQLCSLLARFAARTGTGPLLKALKNEDWFLVSNVVAILQEMGDPAAVPRLLPLLDHKHAKAREAAARALLKFGGKDAADGLADFVARADPEDTAKIVVALSLLPVPGQDARLIAACRKTPHAATRVALVTALGRCPTGAALAFLKEQARRTWFEIMTGRNKELRRAARRSLETLRKDGHA